MDYILLAFCLIYFVKGYFKGFVAMFFSLFGTVTVAVLAWKFSDSLYTYTENFVGKEIFDFLRESLDGMLQGSFSSIEEFQMVIARTKYGTIFSFLISKLIKNITFEGELTTGQILAPFLKSYLIKIINFIVLFLALIIILKIIKLVVVKIVNIADLQTGNKIFGGVLGLAKGIIIFFVFFGVMSILANSLMNEGLLNFVKSGVVSNYIYENCINKIINLF